MLVYLEPWIVEDGQIPELAVGDRLAGIGLWMHGRQLGQSAGIDSLSDVSTAATDPAPLISQLDGVVVWRCAEPEGAVIRVRDLLVVTQGEWIDVAQPPHIDFRLVPLGLPAAGMRVRVNGALEVMPTHCHDPRHGAIPMLGAPDVRADWKVRAIYVEHREPVPGSDVVTRVEGIERMDASADGVYRLDLIPAT